MTGSALEGLILRPPPGADVRRVDANGFPTEALQDQEFLVNDFIRRASTNLDDAITLSKAEYTGLDTTTNARVTQEVQTLADADSAMGLRVDGVEALANDATASGHIYLAATAAPTGATAAYGIYLKAGNVFTGMTLVAKSDGTSAIVFQASQMMLIDAGTLQAVFNYVGGKFKFNVPVEIATGDIANNAVSVMGANAGTINSGNVLAVTKTIKGLGAVKIDVGVGPDVSSGSISGLASTLIPRTANYATFTVTVDGVTVPNGTFWVLDQCTGMTVVSSQITGLYFAPGAGSRTFVVTGLSAGSHIFGLNYFARSDGGTPAYYGSISMTELAK